MEFLHPQFHLYCLVVIVYVCTGDLIQSPENLLVIYLYTSAGFGSELMTVAFMRHIILIDRLVLTEVIFLGDSSIIMHMFGNRKKCPCGIPPQDLWN